MTPGAFCSCKQARYARCNDYEHFFSLISFVAGWAQKTVALHCLRAVPEKKESETVNGLTFWVADENRDERRDVHTNSHLTCLIGVYLNYQIAS